MIVERNTLASEVAAAHRQLTSLQDQSSVECNKLNKPFGSNFVANWQELDDDDDYEFELPR
ncbi:hypothetical protein FBUS_03396 [Fasciolopsis buskii]|uniref:Uncharacterized protein n=1 Tax=Fasciolopsis buskii TaxID=27845 RepID=A0A8E0S504_9TREM|nr:hypothetical protein FBUS_03396 [Fasciolopsis buski]